MDEDSEDEGSSFQKRQDDLSGVYANIEPSLDNLSIQGDMFVGFNGRTNKRADTCYAFWVGASLSVSIPQIRFFAHQLTNIKMLGQAELVESEPVRRFLFEKTQHQIGGFGKCPGNPPGSYFLVLVVVFN